MNLGRMRVAYIVHTFAMGGLERCIARLVNHLDRSRFEPLIVCLNRNGDAAQWLGVEDVPVYELRKRAGNDPRVIGGLKRLLCRERVDLVHSHNWGTLLETTLARRWARVPCHVHAEHGLELADLELPGWRRNLRGIVSRWAMRQADIIVCVAQSVRDKMVERTGCDVDRIHLIGNGVDVPGLDSLGDQPQVLRHQLGVNEDAILLGSIGRLAPVKDFSNAIAATAELVKQDSDVHLVLVGDGPLRSELTQQSRRLGIENRVHLVGQQNHVALYLASMDIYINSSLSEGMSLSILEAMAAGRPCVVTDVGGNALLVAGDDPCGMVVPAADPAALAAGIQRLARDSELRQSLGQRARIRHRQTYSTEVMVRRYEQMYLEGISSLAHRSAPTTAVRVTP